MILLIISSLLSILNIFISKYFFGLDRCVINRGIAFGISMDLAVLISISLLIFLIILGYINIGRIRYIYFSIFLFGFSNLITRLFIGGICDYISLLFLSFNIADLGIVVLCIFGGIKVIDINGKKSK